MRRAALFGLALLLASPAYADMFQDGSNAKLPEARANLGIGGGISAAQYDADGSGATDASAALGAACTAASAAGKPLALAGTYKVSNNLTLTCDLADMGGSRLLPDSGKVITHAGAITAADTAYLFAGAGTTTTSAPYVSVQWWGAGHGIADDAIAFRQATGSNRTIKVPPSSYTFASTQTAPPQAFLPSGWKLDTLNEVVVSGYGASLRMSDPQTYTTVFRVMNSTNIKVFGLTFAGNRTGLSATQPNTAMSFVSVNKVLVQDIHLTGNWGGRSKISDGDWVVNTTFRNITADALGVCFDLAFVKGLLIDNLRAVGATADGSQVAGAAGSKCYSNAYDTVNAGRNTTGVSFADTDGVTVSNSDVSNFANGVFIASGQNYQFVGNNWHDIGGLLNNIPIVDATWAASQATYQTELPHGLLAGAAVTIINMAPPGYNGSFTAAAGTSGNTVVVPMASNPGPVTTLGNLQKPAQGHAITISYYNGGKYSSVGFPPKHIRISDRIVNNGGIVSGRGIFISPVAITNSDVIEDIQVSSTLWNNATVGIGANAAVSMANIGVVGSTFGGTAQIDDVDVNIRGAPGAVVQGNLRVPFLLERRTVANLPTCNAGAEGGMYAVSDANSVVFNAAVVAGGTSKVAAYCDGAGWKVH